MLTFILIGISLRLFDVNIETLFLAISIADGKNFLIEHNIGKRVSINVVDENFENLIEKLEKAFNIKIKRDGNFYYVRSLEKEIQSEEIRKKTYFEEKKRIISYTPSFISAGEISKIIKKYMSPMGSVETIEGNRILIVDIEENIDFLKDVINQLDVEPEQYYISAKIVELSESAVRRISNIINIKGKIKFSAGEEVKGGSIGIAEGELENILKFLEGKGEAKIISSPKILTVSGKTARISQGFSIPYESSRQFAIEIKFVEALLKLEVTPLQMKDEKINLKVLLTKDSPSTPVGGLPSISRNEVFSEAIVGEKETLYIGGIIVEGETLEEEGVPLLKDIPILGFLFKKYERKKEKREIGVFLTPEKI